MHIIFCVKYYRKCAQIFLIIFLFLIINLSYINNGTLANESNLIQDNRRNIDMNAFYDSHNNIKLNISWFPITDTTEIYGIFIHRLSFLQHCGLASEYYEVEGTSSVIIPNNMRHSSFFLSTCVYNLEIKSLSNNDFTYVVNYTIPDTSQAANISVEPFESENNIKLNISWNPATEPLVPTGYHIKVRLDKNNKHFCKMNELLFERHVKANVTSILIEDTVNVHGCTYTVQVIEQPTNDREAPSAKYTIPECVGQKCGCVDDQPLKPAPIVSIKQSTSTTLLISWKITLDELIETKFQLHFRIKISQPKSADLIYFTKTITNRSLNITNFETVSMSNITYGTFYSLYMWYNSSNYCMSKKAYLEFQALPINNSYNIYEIITLMVLIITIYIVLWLIWKKKIHVHIYKCCIVAAHQNPFLSPQINLRRIYVPSTNNMNISPDYLSVCMQYNNLYLEADIMEAVQLGKADKFEYNYNKLQIGPRIGTGAFGEVFIAKAPFISGNNGSTTVAVKKLRRTATADELQEFRAEIAMLKQIGHHPNIVTLLGCCTIKNPYCIIMEYVPNRDLLHYLQSLRLKYEKQRKISHSEAYDRIFNKMWISEQSHSNSTSPHLSSAAETDYTTLGSDNTFVNYQKKSSELEFLIENPGLLDEPLDDLQHFAIQIARGMEHLENKRIIHRDLAARNILIDTNKVLKISDFGLSRSEIYVNKKHKKVPLRWLSIEAIKDNLYTNKSDVWAYGVVLWEIGTLGAFPYAAVRDNLILPFLLDGKRLDKPNYCTDELYSVMMHCWSHYPEKRPSFNELRKYLETITHKQKIYVNFSQLNPTYVLQTDKNETFAKVKDMDDENFNN